MISQDRDSHRALSIRDMLVGGPSRLRYVWRFSSYRVSHRESVAEHSFFVAMYAYWVARWASRTRLISLDMGKLLSRCLIHDIEEAITGDIPRPFKYSDEKVKEALDKAAVVAFHQCLENVCPPQIAECEKLWKEAKANDLEGRILHFADFLSALSYLLQESQDHNRTMLEHINSISAYYNNFATSDYDFIRPLIDQVAPLVLLVEPGGSGG